VPKPVALRRSTNGILDVNAQEPMARRLSNQPAARARKNVAVRIGRPTSVISRLAPVAMRVVKSVNHNVPNTRSRRRSSVSA
jgi:hypothetical protein